MRSVSTLETIDRIVMIALMTATMVLHGCGENDEHPLAPPDPGAGTGGLPSISLSEESVAFSATRNGTPPAQQEVLVTNEGIGTLSELEIALSYDTQSSPSAPAWLEAILDRTTAPATIVLQLLTTSMHEGTHTARVLVSSGSADIAPGMIEVVCSVTSPSAAPQIALSRTSVSFRATVGETTPAAQRVSISNSGSGTLSGLVTDVTYRNGQPAGWLSRSLGSTVAPTALTLSVNTSGLAAGTYEATVTVSSSVAIAGPRSITVSLTVTSPPPTTGAVKVNVVSGGQNIDPTGYVVSVTVVGNLVRTTNVNGNGYVVFSDLAAGEHAVTLEDVAANCIVGGSNPRSVTVIAGITVETTFDVTCSAPPTRRVKIVNDINPGLNLQQVVQVKVAASESSIFTRSDLLTDDPAECLTLPGAAIDRGRSGAFDVTIGDDYSVYLGIGTWDMDNSGCPLGRNWFKRTFFTDPQWNLHYMWVVVNVTGHRSGEWVWTITGSYLDGTLRVTPADTAGLPFRRTTWNPIP
jgi:hypothetical protein